MGKENYAPWLIKIKSTLIFNDLFDGVCEGEIAEHDDDDKSEVTLKEETSIKPMCATKLVFWK